MLNSKPLSIVVAIAAYFTLAATTTAAEVQRWSVQLAGDTAVLRVSKNTEHKFVTATIASLEKTGTDKFALHVLEANHETDITKSAYSLNITDGVAEITATPDLSYKVLESTISQLKDVGITRFKFAANSAGEPASHR